MNLILVVGEEAGSSEPSMRVSADNVKPFVYCLHVVFASGPSSFGGPEDT
jgi:hypothetical protein